MGKKYFERNIFLDNFFRLTIVFCFCALLSSMALCYTAASADINDSAPDSGKCGKHAVWSYDSATETLTISGRGAISKRINMGFPYRPVKRIRILEGITAIDYLEGLDTSPPHGVVSLSLPDSLKRISAGALTGVNMDSITIPSGVETIEPGAFWGTFYLEKIKVSEGNRCFRAADDVLYSYDYETLVHYPRQKKSSSYLVNQNTKTIAPLAFAQNYELKKVVLPEGLTVLGSGAFYHCSTLEEINLSEEMNITAITDYDGTGTGIWDVPGYNEREEDAPFDVEFVKQGIYQMDISSFCLGTFEKTGISSIVIPDSVRYISSNTFFDSSVAEISLGKDFQGGINQLSCASNPKSLTLYYTNIEKVNVSPQNQWYCTEDNILYSKDKKILYQALPSCQSEKVVLPNSVEEIVNGAFYKNEIIEELVVPGNLKSIGRFAFYGSRMKRFNCKGSIETICRCAFEYCMHLKRFRCSEVSVIGVGAFRRCDKLIYFQIKNSTRCNIRSIGKYAFNGCPVRTFRCREIQEIQDGAFYDCQWLVTFYCTDAYSVGRNAFSHCLRLQVLHLGDRVERIAKEALWDCQDLMDITIPSSCVLKTGEYKTFFQCNRLIRVKYRLPASQIELVSYPVVTGPPNTRKMITDGRIESFRAESLKQRENVKNIFMVFPKKNDYKWKEWGIYVQNLKTRENKTDGWRQTERI